MQVNVDFESEQDMVEKARIGLALQPVATALFANSPFRDGKPTGEPVCIHHMQRELVLVYQVCSRCTVPVSRCLMHEHWVI